MPHLENVSADDLRAVLVSVDGKAATKRVMVAINYKEADVTQSELAERYGVSTGWVSMWLHRLERLETEPPEDVVYDAPRPGRPAELDDEQFTRFVDVLHDSPRNAGFDASAWTPSLAKRYLKDRFDADYTVRHVRRLLAEAGLSWKRAQREYSPAHEHRREVFEGDAENRRTIWTSDTQPKGP